MVLPGAVSLTDKRYANRGRREPAPAMQLTAMRMPG